MDDNWDRGPGTGDQSAAQAAGALDGLRSGRTSPPASGPETADRRGVRIPNPESRVPADLDAAIDVVAREMTSGEAPDWLRARVLERIESAAPVHRPSRPVWIWASAAAVITLAIAGSVWLAQRRPATEPVARVASAGSPASESVKTAPREGGPSAPVPDVTVPEASVALAASSSPRAAVRPRRPAVESAALTEWRTLQPAAVAIEPLSVESLQPRGVDIAEIGVEPLVDPEPIVIPSLAPGSYDNQLSEPSRR